MLLLRSIFAIILCLQTLSTQTYALDSFCDSHLSGTSRITTEDTFLKNNNFKVNRDLESYDNHFSFEKSLSFEKMVLTLPPGSTWIDMGAGKAVALVDGLNRNPKIKEAVGIAYARPNGVERYNGPPERFRYLEGDYVENMARDQKLQDLNGRVTLISDLYGPFSYTREIVSLMQVYFNLLKPEGVLVFNVMVKRNHFNYALVPETEMNSIAELRKWLSSIPGTEILDETEFRARSGTFFEDSIAFKIKKTATSVIVPNNIKTLEFESWSPPQRKFGIVLH